jgi:hypothetical protein
MEIDHSEGKRCKDVQGDGNHGPTVMYPQVRQCQGLPENSRS